MSFNVTMRSWRAATALALMLCSLAIFTHVFWLGIKSTVGQLLLKAAWHQSLDEQENQKAWPWADTWPVAELTVPRLGKSYIVLEGVSGEAMAFGPGRIGSLSNTAAEGVYGIGGHRDSHLEFLENVAQGDVLKLQTQDGESQTFTVSTSFVADSDEQQLLVSPDEHALVLITCFPFNPLPTDSFSKRYVVIAVPQVIETAQLGYPSTNSF